MRILKNCKEENKIPTHSKDIIRDLTEELRKYYTLEAIKEHISDGTLLPRMRTFDKSSKYYRRYISRRHNQRKNHKETILPPIRTILDRLYPEYPYLSRLITRTVEHHDFTKEEISEILRNMYFTGEDISTSGLHEERNDIWRWITICAKNRGQNVLRLEINKNGKKEDLGLDKRNRDLTSEIEKLAKIKRANFSIRGSRMIKRISTLSEYFTRLLLHDLYMHDYVSEKITKGLRAAIPFPIEGIYPLNSGPKEDRGLKFEPQPKNYDGEEILADAIVESKNDLCIVEVKNYRNVVDSELRTIKEKLCDTRPLVWTLDKKERRPATQKALFVHSKPDVSQKFKNYFKGSPVQVIEPQEFRQNLEIALSDMEESGYLRTNVYSRAEILRMYDLVVNSPHILVRKSHEQQIGFLEDTLMDLIHRLDKGKIISSKPIEIYGHKGRIIENSKGTFELFKVPLANLEESQKNHISDFVKDKLSHNRYAIPKGALFMDIESTGFVGCQIFLIGTAYNLDGELMFELAFARNPFEEDAMLKHFCTQSEKFEQVVTYNGISFDYTAIRNRLEANMNTNKLQENHLDLYTYTRKQREIQGWESAKLIWLYQMFGDKRDDARSSEMPLIYKNWMTNGSPATIQKDLEHNILDLLGLSALLLSPNLTGYTPKRDK